MMKREIMAAAVGLFLLAQPVSAEMPPMGADTGFMTSIAGMAAMAPSVGEGALSAIWQGIGQSDAAGFLSDDKLPKNTAFTPFDFDPSGKTGLLTIKDKKSVVTAFVAGCEINPKTGEKALADVFDSPSLSPASVSELYQFNLSLLNSENLLNNMFLEMEKRVNQKEGSDLPKVPYNLVTVDYLHVEQLHRVQDKPRIYTSGVRAVFLADGVAIPVYAKSYLMRYRDKYRVLLFITPDSGNGIVKEKADQIAAVSAE